MDQKSTEGSQQKKKQQQQCKLSSNTKFLTQQANLLDLTEFKDTGLSR